MIFSWRSFRWNVWSVISTRVCTIPNFSCVCGTCYFVIGLKSSACAEIECVRVWVEGGGGATITRMIDGAGKIKEHYWCIISKCTRYFLNEIPAEIPGLYRFRCLVTWQWIIMVRGSSPSPAEMSFGKALICHHSIYRMGRGGTCPSATV